MTKGIYFHALAVLHEQGLDHIDWGDPALVEIANRARVEAASPIEGARRVFASLDRATNWFNKEFIMAADKNGRMRRVRRFVVRCIN